MPTLTFKLISNMIPKKAPVLIRSFLKGIFGALDRRFILPRLRVHADFVSASLSLLAALTHDIPQIEARPKKLNPPDLLEGANPQVLTL
jgi:hypothetical protein